MRGMADVRWLVDIDWCLADVGPGCRALRAAPILGEGTPPGDPGGHEGWVALFNSQACARWLHRLAIYLGVASHPVMCFAFRHGVAAK